EKYRYHAGTVPQGKVATRKLRARCIRAGANCLAGVPRVIQYSEWRVQRTCVSTCRSRARGKTDGEGCRSPAHSAGTEAQVSRCEVGSHILTNVLRLPREGR